MFLGMNGDIGKNNITRTTLIARKVSFPSMGECMNAKPLIGRESFSAFRTQKSESENFYIHSNVVFCINRGMLLRH